MQPSQELVMQCRHRQVWFPSRLELRFQYFWCLLRNSASVYCYRWRYHQRDKWLSNPESQGSVCCSASIYPKTEDTLSLNYDLWYADAMRKDCVTHTGSWFWIDPSMMDMITSVQCVVSSTTLNMNKLEASLIRDWVVKRSYYGSLLSLLYVYVLTQSKLTVWD